MEDTSAVAKASEAGVSWSPGMAVPGFDSSFGEEEKETNITSVGKRERARRERPSHKSQVSDLSSHSWECPLTSSPQQRVSCVAGGPLATLTASGTLERKGGQDGTPIPVARARKFSEASSAIDKRWL